MKITILIAILFFMIFLLPCSLVPQGIMLERSYGQKSPGKTPEIYNPRFSFLKGVKTDYIVFSRDGKDICYVIEDTNSMERNDRNYIYYTNLKKGKWIKPQIAYFVANQGKGTLPQFSPDGNRFSYSYKGDLWTSLKKSGRWSVAEKYPQPINSEKYECGFSLVKGDRLYFASGGRPEGKSKQCDIYCATIKNDTCETAQNLSNLNTERSECVLAAAPDEKYIIFTRYFIKLGKNTVDLFISFRKKDGTWTVAQKLDSTFNSPGSNQAPRLSPDGRYFFFNQSTLTDSSVTEMKHYWVGTQFIEEMRESVLKNDEK